MCMKMWFIHEMIKHCCNYMFTYTYITTDNQKSMDLKPQSEKFIEKGETVDRLFLSVRTLKLM